MTSSRFRYTVIGTFVAIASSAATWVAFSQTDYGIPAFTYELVQTIYPTDGSSAPVIKRETHALRSDGSTMVFHHIATANGATYGLRQIDDLKAQRRTFVNDGAQTTATSLISQERVDQVRRGPGRLCGLPAATEVTMWNGYEALRHVAASVSSPELGGRSHEMERWLVPVLGCAPVRMLKRDNGQLRVNYSAENIRIGEPDPALFRIPPHYVEAAPSEMHRRLQERFGGPAYNASGEMEGRVEQIYIRRRGELLKAETE
jgi:hypothetical protein